MSHAAYRLAVVAALALSGCARERGQSYAVDAGGRPISAIESGSSLFVGARGLTPGTLYEFRLGTDRRAMDSRAEAIGFARAMTDGAGTVPPFILWYETGVVGCSEPDTPRRGPFRFQSFEEAERRLRDVVLTVSAHPVERDPTGERAPLELEVGPAEATFDLPVIHRQSPMVFPSTADGCLRNSQLTGDSDMYVSGRNFAPGERLEISVVPNQRVWRVGDAIDDVTGASFAAAPEGVTVDSAGRFTVRVWERTLQRRGAYDIIAHRPTEDTTFVRRVGPGDIASFGAETGFVLFLRYPVGGPTMDIAGRPVPRRPYFEFADAFADTLDPVWGAVDPTYVPVGHPGGTWAAYYIVRHRDVNGWDPTAGGSTAIIDDSDGIEIHPVKAGCINGTDVIIWSSQIKLGEFDVVVEFGNTAATSPGTYSTDSNYDATVDFLDGADQVGFVIAEDPYELGPFAIGADSYTQDDYFPTFGTAVNVDLRAVVRYPATSAGTGTPVATGAHPLFVIEHGNHFACRVFNHTRASCPDRVKNHEGYMRLLEILASHGVIAVSIDAYDLTGWYDLTEPTPGWIPERGDLILKHLELWSHMNNTSTFTSYPDFFAGRFAGHVDLSKISVSGHSRGGEASVAAYVQNSNPAFSIRAVSSIAPVDFQSFVLPDVPYFVILPAADCDVTNLAGARIYDRAGSALPTPDGTTKSGIYVYGANHNFFNTVWAADGDDCPNNLRADYIQPADQQRLGEAYLAAFTRVHLLNETVYEDMLRGRLVFPSTAGYKNYALHHEKSHARLMSGSPGSFVPTGATVAGVTNVLPHLTQATKVGWSAGTDRVTYSVPVALRNASTFEVVALRAAQTGAATNPATGSQSFMLELVGGGKSQSVTIDQFDPLPRPYAHPYGISHYVMTVVRVPLHSYIMNKAGVTLNNIDTIRLRFSSPTSGEIYVDDLEFSR